MTEWFRMLAAARTRLKIEQTELAARAHVSLASLKAYEQGRRHPSQPYLTALLEAMKLPVMERNAIMSAVGYAPDGTDVVPYPMDYDFTGEAAQAEIDRAAWPAFVLNDASEVVFANKLMERVWDVDMRGEYADIADRSLLSVASDPRFADRILNWDEAIGSLASVFKGHYRGGEDLENPSPAFRRIMNAFLAGDPKYIARFLKLWQEVPQAEMLLRWHYRIVWDVPGAGAIEFDCVVSHCNQEQAWTFNDWIPVDAASWGVLEQVKARHAGGRKR